MNKKVLTIFICLAMLILAMPLFAESQTEIVLDAGNATSLTDAFGAIDPHYKSTTINLKDDIDLTSVLSTKKSTFYAIINGEGHTLHFTSASYQKTAIKFELYSVETNDAYVIFNNVNFVFDGQIRDGIKFHSKNGKKINAVFNNCTFEFARTSTPTDGSNEQFGALIVNNYGNVIVDGDCSFTTDKYCYCAIDVSSNDSYSNGKLRFNDEADVSFSDGRNAEKKKTEPLVKSSDDNKKSIVENFGIAGLQYVDKSVVAGKTSFGYDLPNGHTHGNWSYSVSEDGTKIIATCGNDSCTLLNSQAFIGISAPGKVQLSATVGPDEASNKGVEWRSSNRSIATVDENGLVTAKNAGQVTITATAKDGSLNEKSIKIKVTE